MEEFESEVIDIDTEWDALMSELFAENFSTESNGWE
jgi:hypothetical protein